MIVQSSVQSSPASSPASSPVQSSVQSSPVQSSVLQSFVFLDGNRNHLSVPQRPVPSSYSERYFAP